MSRVYIADKTTLDKVLQKTDAILANLMAMNDDETLKTKVAANYFNTRRTGKVFGTFFNDFTGSQKPEGTRKFDSVNMIARPSTDTVADRNDFDEYAIFNGLTVNGHVDATGEFVVEAFEGEDTFSKTDKDVYILLGTSWVNIDIDSLGETISVTDKPRDGYFPMPGAVKPNGDIRPFIPMAKYLACNHGGSVASVSGQIPHHNNASHNWCQTEFHKKGTQYCATTFQDRFLIETLFQVIFATRNSQSVMKGCTSYNYQPKIAKVEGKASNRVLVAEGQGKNFVVDSRASVGTGTNTDRNASTANQIADRRLVTKIEQGISVDGGKYDAIYLDGAAFEVTATTDFISTMPWDTGACDNVLGSCGSRGDNTSGKYPFVFCGIEMANGQYEVLGNVIYKQSGEAGSWKGQYYVCYDATKLTTVSGNENYKLLDYEIDLSALTAAGWKYTSEMGFDKANPGARMPKKVAATTSTGYCDGCYLAVSAGDREVLLGGNLAYGLLAGVWCRTLHVSLAYTCWTISARLSATGMCGVKAA